MFHSNLNNEGCDYLKYLNYHIGGHMPQDDQPFGRIVPNFTYHNATNMKTTDEADVDSSLHSENYLFGAPYKKRCDVFVDRAPSNVNV